MIQISVDEAVAFDMLAILSIKSRKNPIPSLFANELALSAEIEHQLGDRYMAVMESSEYDRLYQTNLRVFDRIDLLKSRGEQPGDATFIDQENYQRWLCKRDLQRQFFPGSPFTEQKLGYDQPRQPPAA